jgi:hypothetical protein
MSELMKTLNMIFLGIEIIIEKKLIKSEVDFILKHMSKDDQNISNKSKEEIKQIHIILYSNIIKELISDDKKHEELLDKISQIS